MKEDFVTYEIAKKLKEKGFDEYCEYGHLLEGGKGVLYTPTIAQILKWLREEKKVYVLITPYPSMAAKNKIVWAWGINWNSDGVDIRTFSDDDTYISYEEAALAGITWVLDNII